MELSVSLAEIFTPYGPGGSAPHVKYDWAIHDLWAHRMSEETAEELLSSMKDAEREAILKKANWYNATEISYAKGLAKGDERLFGEKIGVVEAGGILKADVKSHAARVFRLRRIAREGDEFEAKSISRNEGDERDEL
jgi:alpha-galactosidase